MKRTPVKRKRSKPRRGRILDSKYLKFITEQPCLITAQMGGVCGGKVEAHHAGDHGFGQKADDSTAVPLCNFHHLYGPCAVHVLGKRFWKFWELDRDAEIKRLNLLYGRDAAKPTDPGA